MLLCFWCFFVLQNAAGTVVAIAGGVKTHLE